MGTPAEKLLRQHALIQQEFPSQAFRRLGEIQEGLNATNSVLKPWFVFLLEMPNSATRTLSPEPVNPVATLLKMEPELLDQREEAGPHGLHQEQALRLTLVLDISICQKDRTGRLAGRSIPGTNSITRARMSPNKLMSDPEQPQRSASGILMLSQVSRANSTISRASPSFTASGFSHTTCFPAFKAILACGRCMV